MKQNRSKKTPSLKEKMQMEHYGYRHRKIISRMLSKMKKGTFYIPCLEVPVTTYCTLCCEECANLIQYYKQPYHVPVEKIINSIKKISSAVEGIDCVRILGGEPLLHPDLNILLQYLAGEGKIRNVTIVTNGTLQFGRDALSILEDGRKFKVSISQYSCAKERSRDIIRQLQRSGVKYAVNHVIWKERGAVLYQGKSAKKLKSSFKNCPNHFFSLLNGELHLCPRSSHGTDLGIIPKFPCDFVDLQGEDEPPEVIRRKIEYLLERPYVAACNYCNEDRAGELKTVESGKQTRRSDMQKRLNEMLEYNQSCR